MLWIATMDEPVVIRAIMAIVRIVSLSLMLTTFRVERFGCVVIVSYLGVRFPRGDIGSLSVPLVIIFLRFLFCHLLRERRYLTPGRGGHAYDNTA
jgi:hypothetical protein